jgi:hypothetical protein
MLSIESIPIKTKELVRKNRYGKIGLSRPIKKNSSVGYNPSKKLWYLGYKATYIAPTACI